jgi:hypothetical protein
MYIEMQLKLGFSSDLFVDFFDWEMACISNMQTVVKKVWTFTFHKMLQLLPSWATVSVPESLLVHEVYLLLTHASYKHRPTQCPFSVIISSEQWQCWLFRFPLDSSDICKVFVFLALKDKPTFTVRQEENGQICSCLSVCEYFNIHVFVRV